MLLSSLSLSSLLIVLLSLSSVHLFYCRRISPYVIVVVIILAFTSGIYLIAPLFMFLLSSSLSSRLLVLLSLPPFSLCYSPRRRHYCRCRLSLYVIVVVVIIALSSVVIIILLLLMLLSSSSSLLLLVVLFLPPFSLCYCRRRYYHCYKCYYRYHPPIYVLSSSSLSSLLVVLLSLSSFYLCY